MAAEEKRLIEQAQRGDMAAFQILVDRYKRQVYFLALDLSGNHHDAEDISQEVFLRALRFLKKFRGEARISSWLYRIAVNCYLDSRRKKQVTTVSLNEAPGEDMAAPQERIPDEQSPDPEEQTRAAEIQGHIQQALEQLTPRERSVFVLRHYRNLPLKEIAQTLEVAEGTVKSLLFRAVKRLQQELAFYRADLGLDENSS